METKTLIKKKELKEKSLSVKVKAQLLDMKPVDQLIFKTVFKHQPVTRPELVELTSIPRSTIYDALTRLEIRGLIRKYPEMNRTPGRPRTLFEVTIEST